MIIEQLEKSEIKRLGEMDRSEKVTLLYKYSKGKLLPEETDLNVPRWREEDVERQINKLSAELDQGGTLFGATDGGVLAGLAVLGNKFVGEHSDELQLASLHVSRAYRRQGIATKLFEAASKIAKEKGAKRLYISVTPSESAVGFYLSHGCKLATHVDEELFAQEPEDIHMIKEL